MKRERKFYTEHKKHMEELEAMLEAEDDEGEESDDSFLEKLSRIKLEPNPEKIEKFNKLAKRAEVMAEMLYYDIRIESDEKFGKIEISSPDMLVPAPVDPKAKKILAWLIAEANDICISSEMGEETVHIRLLYELFDEHYVWIDRL